MHNIFSAVFSIDKLGIAVFLKTAKTLLNNGCDFRLQCRSA